jgi:hypothetical protein
MDPTLASYFITSWHDDRTGLMRTYTLGMDRRLTSHVLGSTSMFINMVNTIIAGALGALIANAAGRGPAAVSVIGTVSGLAYLAATLAVFRRSFSRPPIETRFPTPPD